MNNTKHTIYAILLTLLVMGIVWVFISTSGDNEYNNHMCQDVYGLDENCK